jgi:GT2 family glycosyltransferase
LTPELTIVVVNWNGGAYLRRCIQSVLESPPAVTYELLIVDNGSTDGSIESLRSSVSSGASIRFIENSENLGFGMANNQAFASSTSPLLLLLNNDAEVTPNSIDTLISTLQTDERIGACGPRLVNSDGSLQVSAWRNPPTPWEILVSGLRLYRVLPSRFRGDLLLGRFWDHSRRRKVGMLSGAAILVKRAVIDEVGGFDEQFHMYAEDDEWCLRVSQAGWSLIFEPDAVMIHHGGKSASVRWNNLERQSQIVEAGLRFQKHSLTKSHFISNLLANSVVVSLAYVWKKATGVEAAEARMKLGLYLGYLRRALKEE